MPSLHEIVRKVKSIPLPNVGEQRIPERWRFNECGHDKFERTCRKCVNIRVEGVAGSGEVSRQGIVAHREHWDDTEDALVSPYPIVMGLQMQPQPERKLHFVRRRTRN